MIYETIDLYERFPVPRGGSGGMLTAYCPTRRGDLGEKLRPAALILPGGGYAAISGRESEPVALRFLAEGYSVFVLDYTVNAAYPVPLVEAAMAMAYIRKNARRYSADAGHVAAAGFSAGGHLAGMLATLHGEAPVKEALKGDAALVRPDAAILAYPVVTTGEKTHEGTASVISGGDASLRAALSLENRVTGESSPAFIWHTSEDELVPVENALLLAGAYRGAGVPFELHIFERGRHGLSVASRETETDERALAQGRHAAAWIGLALTWLGQRGFSVRL